jgi:hypothetical protein
MDMPSASREHDNSKKDSTKFEYFKNQIIPLITTFTNLIQTTFVKRTSFFKIAILFEIPSLLGNLS